ncbi:hypothetical protein [Thermosyntropha sp.]|uniref:hypothetical protein n=1 Tax=Thermosyntropha sp. TaxID=2740820 RepID=UPI0025F512CF|nr:hypothetical protein [Thermosyntropha sp.]MBO8159714.1 hypothetical protein [Thermosyntropha sp.]
MDYIKNPHDRYFKENIEGAVKIFLEFMRIIFHPDKEVFKIELAKNLTDNLIYFR